MAKIPANAISHATYIEMSIAGETPKVPDGIEVIGVWDMRVIPQMQWFGKDVEIELPVKFERDRLQAYQFINNQWLPLLIADTDKEVVRLKTSQIAPVMVGVKIEDGVYAYPNPATGQITFRGFEPGAVVKIFTITGEIVRILDDRDRNGFEIWDTVNDDGEGVASGIYLWLMVDHKKSYKGKVGIAK